MTASLGSWERTASRRNRPSKPKRASRRSRSRKPKKASRRSRFRKPKRTSPLTGFCWRAEAEALHRGLFLVIHGVWRGVLVPPHRWSTLLLFSSTGRVSARKWFVESAEWAFKFQVWAYEPEVYPARWLLERLQNSEGDMTNSTNTIAGMSCISGEENDGRSLLLFSSEWIPIRQTIQNSLQMVPGQFGVVILQLWDRWSAIPQRTVSISLKLNFRSVVNFLVPVNCSQGHNIQIAYKSTALVPFDFIRHAWMVLQCSRNPN